MAGVAQIATRRPPAAAGLMAGTVPITGSPGSSSDRSASRAWTEAVLHATTSASGACAAAARAQASACSATSAGVRGPQGIPSGSEESTRSTSGRRFRRAAAAASRPMPESTSAIFTGNDSSRYPPSPSRCGRLPE